MTQELSENQKQKIEAEERYRSQVREELVEKPRRYMPVIQARQSGCSGCVVALLIIAILGIISVGILSAINLSPGLNY